MSEAGLGLCSGGWREEEEVLFSAPGPENDVFLSQTFALPPKLLGRGSWLRAPRIGAGCLPGRCIWVGGQRHLGAVISLLTDG